MTNSTAKAKAFVLPYYASKDIMHDITHIERILQALDELLKEEHLHHDRQVIELAAYFHGIIYAEEEAIREFLQKNGYGSEKCDHIIKVAWESQKEHKPATNEGLLLHDAHMLEGGPAFEIIKSLITGSVRGQSLEETMIYIERNLLNKGRCYTETGKRKYRVMQRRTREIYQELNAGLHRKPSI